MIPLSSMGHILSSFHDYDALYNIVGPNVRIDVYYGLHDDYCWKRHSHAYQKVLLTGVQIGAHSDDGLGRASYM